MPTLRYFRRFFLAAAALAAIAVPAGAADTPNAIFLVATRELLDPNFEKTVVLVTYPPSGTPFGVIINRPLADRLAEAMPDQPALKERKDVLYSGGPVSREGLVFLVRGSNPPPGALLVLPDVFFTADADLIESLLQRKNPLDGVRVFAGYSGWGPGQLQREIARGDWRVLPADSKTVFDKDPKWIWPEMIDRATSKQTNYPKTLHLLPPQGEGWDGGGVKVPGRPHPHPAPAEGGAGFHRLHRWM